MYPDPAERGGVPSAVWTSIKIEKVDREAYNEVEDLD